MAKDKSSKSSKSEPENKKSKAVEAMAAGRAAKAEAKAKATANVVANARLVEAIRSYTTAIEQSKSYLVTIGEIVQSEMLTRAEVVASLMEARGITKETAESQFSRMKNLLTNPEVLEAVKNGEMDLKQARTATTKKQAAPSEEKKKQNAEKRLATAVTTIVNVAKESGLDVATVINTVKAALKKGGVK